ncbi:hypothetical protein RJ639_033621 [Escallonia herrerae]|uniref:ABC transporter domain-containing protein n=1 Tax=Escallonia herrerae TaxID=1293975 RepID=A0AA89BK38_9ASTE|nr:hypothetical protein RJ639_033621 [Escallonia herrerae]
MENLAVRRYEDTKLAEPLFCRVGLELPTVQVRYHNLSVHAESQVVHVRPLPTLWNTLKSIFSAITTIIAYKPQENKIKILQDVHGVIKPSRLTLLLGPPGCGKTTLLLALAGRLDQSLKLYWRIFYTQVTGDISYNGYKFDEFVPQKTSASVSQYDLHISEMTVRESLDFAARCQGIGSRAATISLSEVVGRSIVLLNITNAKPYWQEIAVEGLKRTLQTDYILKVLPSVRVNYKNHLHIPFLIEYFSYKYCSICCLDPWTGYLRRYNSGRSNEKRNIRWTEEKADNSRYFHLPGEIIIGPAKVPFMDEISTGLDTFQIVTCLQQWTHITGSTIVVSLLQPVPETFDLFDDIILMSEGQTLYHGPTSDILEFFEHCSFKCPPRKGVADFLQELVVIAFITMTVFIRTRMNMDAIHANYYTSSSFYSLIRLMCNGIAELSMTVSRLAVFYKRRDFYPAWSYFIPAAILKIPFCIARRLHLDSPYLLCHWLQSRTREVVLSGHSFTDTEFSSFGITDVYMPVQIFPAIPPPFCPTSSLYIIIPLYCFYVPESICFCIFWRLLLASDGFVWWLHNSTTHFACMVGMGLLAFSITLMQQDAFVTFFELLANELKVADNKHSPYSSWLMQHYFADSSGMVLPFEPMAITFEKVKYFVDIPKKMRRQGSEQKWLQLLQDVTGAFRAGVLTALMGVSGAGKTKLLDVLSGRKTGGVIKGDVRIGGHPKVQETYARISGYCEQTDIHSSQITVKESLAYSAWLRLPPQIHQRTKSDFVAEVLQMIELDDIKDALVGFSGVSGISLEQRKRLTIAVELVSNPSIIFMDEPTSGLDARAAAIVMRVVKKIANTRTGVCTIHQPSIDIFEAFDEDIPGVPKIHDNYNPAAWMLQVTGSSAEAQLGLDFAPLYNQSHLYRYNEQDLFNILGSMLIFLLFLGISNGSSVQSVIATERTIVYRERFGGMYSSPVYAFAQAATEIPYVLLQAVIFVIITYPAIDIHLSLDKVFWNLVLQRHSGIAIWDTHIAVNGESVEIKAFLHSYFGYLHDDLGHIALVLISFPLVFASVFAYFIAKLNFQKR